MLGGYAGLLCGYDTANLWFGFNAVGNLSPVFTRIYTEKYKPTPDGIGALDKNQNGADIPNKSKFIDNIGLRDTVNKTNDLYSRAVVLDIRLSTREQVQVWNGPGYGDQPPYVITGVLNSNRDEFPDTLYRRALQKLINGTWYNVGGL